MSGRCQCEPTSPSFSTVQSRRRCVGSAPVFSADQLWRTRELATYPGHRRPGAGVTCGRFCRPILVERRHADPARRVPDPPGAAVAALPHIERPERVRPVLPERPRSHGRRVPGDRPRRVPQSRRYRRLRNRSRGRRAALGPLLGRARRRPDGSTRRRLFDRRRRAAVASAGALRRRRSRRRVRPGVAGGLPGGRRGAAHAAYGQSPDPRRPTVRPGGIVERPAARRRHHLRRHPRCVDRHP